MDFALTWDHVRPVRFGRYSELDRWIPELTNRSRARTSDNPDFTHMWDELQLINQQKALTELPLNEAALRQQRDQFDKAQIDIENQRRMAKNQSPISSLDELLAESAEGEEPVNADAEALLRESGELTIDLIELQIEHGRQLKSS